MKMDIRDIEISKGSTRELGNIGSLAESIAKHGMLQPIVINQNNELIAGRRRLEAAKFLGWKEIDVKVIETGDDYDRLAKTITENIQRKQLNWQEEVLSVEELDGLMRKKYGSAKQGERTDLIEEKSWSSLDTAKMLQKGEGRVREEIILAKALKKYPELEKKRTKTAAFRELKNIKQRERLAEEPRPEGVYDVVVVNPPWEYPGTDGMTIDEIISLDLPFSENSIVFLWTTVRYLPVAFEIFRKWGVQYKNLITWRKRIGGMGHWGRVVTEHCLLGIKGRPVADFRNISNFIEGEKSEHGGKPNEFYQIINQTYSGKKLDVFGTEKRDGWSIVL
ncbi:MAG: ParB N-terminal domain-containing protein [Theionarchaea archaeon]|nr:ParB N-terminal domain-containing protein [Theionarchaea archaeon]